MTPSPADAATSPRPGPPPRRRAGSLGALWLAAILVLMVGQVLLGVALLYVAGAAVNRITTAGANLDAVRRELDVERGLEREYLAIPRESLATWREDASASVIQALSSFASSGSAADRVLAHNIRVLNEQYMSAVRLRAPADQIDGAFRRVEAQVNAAADRTRSTVADRVQDLVGLQRRMLIAAPLLLFGELCLVALIWQRLRRSRRRLEESLFNEAGAIYAEEQRFRSLVQNAPDMILVCAASGHVTHQNLASELTWGYAQPGLLHQSIHALAHPDDRPGFATFWSQLPPPPEGPTHPRPNRIEARLRNARGEWRHAVILASNHLNDIAIKGVVLTVRDVHEARAAQQLLGHQALLDTATRLPNPVLFRDRLEQALLRSAEHRDTVALSILVLHGPAGREQVAGPDDDAFALEVAVRIRACLRPQDTVGRLGPNRFGVIHAFKTARGGALGIAKAVAEQLRRPVRLAAEDVAVQASIGVAAAEPGQDPESLLRNAELAAHKAQGELAPDEAGGAADIRYALFEQLPRLNEFDHAELASDLRFADLELEFRVHYQPIVLIASGELEGVEALVRWQHPRRGLVPPNDFLPLAEETGMIVPLGRWILAETCRQLVSWQAQYRYEPPLTLSVNLSAVQFHGPTLLEDVGQALRASGLAPGCLKLEITESAIMREPDATVRTMGALQRLGVQIAIDDFGAGYSPLTFLKQLPIQLVKIDGSFVRGVGTSEEDTATVRAIIARAESLGWQATAENVETTGQAALLTQMGCRFGQGYLYSKAVAEQEAVAFLRTSDRPQPRDDRRRDALRERAINPVG